MKQLNKKGFTTVEVIVCFVVVMVITMSMYSVISYYNEKRILEGYKQKVVDYKNQLTQIIQSDMTRIGLIDANVQKDYDLDSATSTYRVDMNLRDSTKRTLIVEQTLTESPYHPQGSAGVDDRFRIVYGPPSEMVEYDIPKLGTYTTESGKIAQDLSINNILIEVVDERVLSIYIGFYHPELGTRYAIDIMAPVDFVFTN